MKTINTNKPNKSIINKAILGAFIAFTFIFTPIHSAGAGTDTGFSDYSGGYGGVYDYGSSGYGGVYDYGSSGYGGVYDYGSSGYGGIYDYGSSGYGGIYDYGSYDSYYPSYDYGSYSAPAYNYGGYGGGGGYSYTPAPVYDYVYNTPSSGGASAPQMQYVYSSNENTNTNANTNNNTITNTFNPTNNNDARINLVVYGGGGSNAVTGQPSLEGSCVINPTVGYVNQDVTFSASASGGNGSYSYAWTGDNGINSAAQSFTGRFGYSGYKTVTVTIRSGFDTITRTCGVNIQGYNVVQNTQSNVTVIRDQQNLGTPVSGIFLSQVPETGIGFGLKMTLFSVGLILWSIFAAYMISRKKNGAFANKINAFKLANMQKKGITG